MCVSQTAAAGSFCESQPATAPLRGAKQSAGFSPLVWDCFVLRPRSEGVEGEDRDRSDPKCSVPLAMTQEGVKDAEMKAEAQNCVKDRRDGDRREPVRSEAEYGSGSGLPDSLTRRGTPELFYCVDFASV